MNDVASVKGNEDFLKVIKDFDLLVSEFDESDRSSSFVPHSEQDPLRNVKRALAEKLSVSTGKPLSECERDVEELVDKIRSELLKPKVKDKLCSALKVLSGDVSDLSIGVVTGVIVALVAGGTLTLPALPIYGLSLIATVYFLLRGGIQFICFESSKD